MTYYYNSMYIYAYVKRDNLLQYTWIEWYTKIRSEHVQVFTGYLGVAMTRAIVDAQ